MSVAAGQPDRPVTYAEFRSRLFARHESPATAAVSTIGDTLLLGGPLLGLLARRWQVAAAGLAVGAAVTAAAHLLQPGTMRAELEGIARHPLWSMRAELERVAGRTP
jgi:hypothetical protein